MSHVHSIFQMWYLPSPKCHIYLAQMLHILLSDVTSGHTRYHICARPDVTSAPAQMSHLELADFALIQMSHLAPSRYHIWLRKMSHLQKRAFLRCDICKMCFFPDVTSGSPDVTSATLLPHVTSRHQMWHLMFARDPSLATRRAPRNKPPS
jgi:hypothetical protein